MSMLVLHDVGYRSTLPIMDTIFEYDSNLLQVYRMRMDPLSIFDKVRTHRHVRHDDVQEAAIHERTVQWQNIWMAASRSMTPVVQDIVLKACKDS
jgi:hypothetical protein